MTVTSFDLAFEPGDAQASVLVLIERRGETRQAQDSEAIWAFVDRVRLRRSCRAGSRVSPASGIRFNGGSRTAPEAPPAYWAPALPAPF